MLRRLDESSFLNRLLQTVSARLAKQRGLPVVIGIVLVLISMGVRLLNIPLESKLLEAVYVVLHDGGIVIALIGLLMVEPLGN